MNIIHAAKLMLALRKRLKDSTLSHCVKNGKSRLCSVTHDARGRCIIKWLSPWQSHEKHLETLKNYKP